MKRIKFGDYAGFNKPGTTEISKEDRYTHLLRASWLTAMVESGGKFGNVMNIDGTAMTAGIHQAIAVFPRELKNPDAIAWNDQGPLWRLLRPVWAETPGAQLWVEIENLGWVIGRDLRVRWENTGNYVDGFQIREEFTGSRDGVAPVRGKARQRAERWIDLFHEVFADPRTFEVQEDFGLDHFSKYSDRAKLRFSRLPQYEKLTIDDVFYSGTSAELATFEDEPELDLALCIFWSHGVNAPGMALKVLCRSLPKWDAAKRKIWAKHFIAKIGNTKYGRWDDDIKHGRYQRTREFAMESGFWPDELFTGKGAIMPADLPG